MPLLTIWIAKLIATLIDRVVSRHAGKIVLLSLILTLVSVAVIAARHNINSDFKALLPASSAAAQAMDEIDARVGGGSSLFVVIDSPDREANLRFAQAYAERLRQTEGVALAHYHNDKAFFEQRQLLYMEVEDLEALYERVAKRIKDAKKEANPLFVSLGPKKSAKADTDAADLRALQDKYADRMVHQGYKEYLTSDDGYAVVIMVRFVESSTNLVATNRLIDQVRAMVDQLQPSSYHAELVVEFGGGLANRQTQYRSIVEDIQTSALFTVLGVFLLIALYFGRLRAIVVVLGPLIMSVGWTLATAFLIFGELTAITVFIFTILLGLGIDFGIHLLSGYDHARQDGHEPEAALKLCFEGTGKATVVGGLTTFVTFVVLSFAQFRGLSQFGVVASIGIVYTLAAMLGVLPSLVLVLQRRWPHTLKRDAQRPGLVARQMSPARVERGLKLALPLALALGVVGTAWAGSRLEQLRFEEDFYQISKVPWPWAPPDDPRSPSQRQAERRAAALALHLDQRAEAIRRDLDPQTYRATRRQKTLGQKYSNAVQGRQTSMPTILLFDEPAQAQETFARMDRALATQDLKTIRAINAIYSFLPGSPQEQAARMAPIRKLRELLEGESLSFVKQAEREQLEALKAKTQIEPFGIYDLPDWTKRLFREAGHKASPAAPGQEFSFERIIYVTEAVALFNGPEARQYMSQIRQSAGDQDAQALRVGSQAYVYIAMLDEIRADGARMMGIALVLVLLILVVAFGAKGWSLLAMMPLLVGGLWGVGLCTWLGVRLDFFNMIIIPALIGIGVDDGVHFVMRYVELGRGSLPVVLRQVGGAIVMTSVTSMIGFGGLAITHYAGLKSIGHLAIVGILSTLLATLLLLPTAIWLYERLTPDRAP